MKNNYFPSSWNDPVVTHYDQTIPLKIAGYHLLYDMTSRLMKAGLADGNSKSPHELLIVGAGGGQELVTLGQFDPYWRFTAIDSSSAMLDIARRRIEEQKVSDRVHIVTGKIEHFSEATLYDGATCLLVLHFIKGLKQKRQLLSQIAAKLKPRAPFFLASINGEPNSIAFSVQMDAWKSHMVAQGITEERFNEFRLSIGDDTRSTGSDVISGEATVAMLAECGFTNISRYFGSYLIEGYIAFKK